ncbi:MAG: 3-dehydroquinate synthase [Alistipes sp.]|nr:3-dehydroquinate synthase [Alistipes sp.]
MSTVISIKQKSEIFVGRVEDGLKRYAQNRRIVVITDANIDRLYHDIINKYEHIIIGYGEGIKNLITVQNIYARLMEIGADRSTLLIGIGGGIVTDITGFVATTYMRGLDFGFVATTLLAQVDASVGGKNGVNILNYKNMVGTFAQPSFVISDVAFLRTLPHRELHAGMGEVVKMAIIGDEELFNFIEENISASCYTNIDTMQRIVLDSIRLKADIVDRDECEKGIRRVLNLGHTIAHAIEKCTHKLNHGEAVAVGLSKISHISNAMGILSNEDMQRIDNLLQKIGFSLEIPVPLSDVIREVRHDKKKSNNILRIVLPERIGSCRIEEMPLGDVEHILDYLR